MAVDAKTISGAIGAIAGLPFLVFDPEFLAEDVHLLSGVFPSDEEFLAATASTVRALRQLAANRVSASDLVGNHSGWRSYHYQHRRRQGQSANMRIIYRCEPEGVVHLKAFGHRHLPDDIYRHIATTRAIAG